MRSPLGGGCFGAAGFSIGGHTMSKSNATTVAKINNTNILVIENGEKRIAVKPICEALGVDSSSQLQKLKTDPMLKSTVVLSTTVGADGKDREMTTIPFKYVFGWLFRIDSRNVKEEAREAVLRYQKECYDVLYEHFVELDEYLKYRSKLVEQKYEELEKLREKFRGIKGELEEGKKQVADAKSITIDTYRAGKAQLQMEFPEDQSQLIN